MNRRALLLAILEALFFGRVTGQILATLVGPSWLPSAEHWFSGALPYPILLPAQILLLMFMTVVTYDAFRQQGRLHPAKADTRRLLRRLAYVYYLAMVARYAITMALVPELRWLGHGIPIVFHFVLASYLLVLGTAPESFRRRSGGRLRRRPA